MGCLEYTQGQMKKIKLIWHILHESQCTRWKCILCNVHFFFGNIIIIYVKDVIFKKGTNKAFKKGSDSLIKMDNKLWGSVWVRLGACFLFVLRRNAAIKLSRPRRFWQIGCEAFTTDAQIAKIISAKIPLWPARGTWHAPQCAALSNLIFPGQCKWWQIPSSCIMRFAANLPNSRVRGGICTLSWGACCLAEWCWSSSVYPSVQTQARWLIPSYNIKRSKCSG